MTAYDLTPERSRSARQRDHEPARQRQRLLHLGDHRHQTADRAVIAAGERHQTWNREAALGTGNDFTPNALINATEAIRFTTWQAKLYTTINLPLDVRLVPHRPIAIGHSVHPHVRSHARLRQRDHQGRTDRRQSDADITLVDLRTEKAFRSRYTRDGILGHLQPLEHERRADLDDQLGCRVAAAHRDHRAAHRPDRRPPGVVA